MSIAATLKWVVFLLLLFTFLKEGLPGVKLLVVLWGRQTIQRVPCTENPSTSAPAVVILGLVLACGL